MEHPTPCLSAGLIGPCPECSNGRLQPVSDGDRTNFLCDRCGICWHAEVDAVSRVNPSTCPGCPQRDVCQASRRAYWASLVVAGAAVAPSIALRQWTSPESTVEAGSPRPS